MSEEHLRGTISVDDVYRRAARKSIIFFIEGDRESEENLAMELRHVREDPEIFYGPILEVIEELFPDGKYPDHIKTLYEKMKAQASQRGAVLDDSMLTLGMNLVEALSNRKQPDTEDES